MATAYVGVGSNLDDPASQVRRAIDALAKLAGVRGHRASPLYRTAPWGGIEQPDFVNAVVELDCSIPPEALMASLLDIESRMGRLRNGRRWGPRVIDLDLLAFGDRTIAEPGLTVPHPEITGRAFVLVPWAALAPAFEVPGMGTVEHLLNRLMRHLPAQDTPESME